MLSSVRDTIKQLLPRSLLIRQLDTCATNCVMLTFDDGPHPEITPAVLDRLKAYEARAVFFIVGRRIHRVPYLLKAIQEHGHLIGNHTYIHSNGRQPWFWEYYRDLQKCQLLIEKHTGKKPELFRPAGGRISFSSLIVPKLLNLRTVSWSVEASDWRCRTGKEACKTAEYLIHLLGPGDIVLLHDDNPYVVQILDTILPVIRERRLDLRSGIESLLPA